MNIEAMYIISTIEQAEQDKYKLGNHTGTDKKLKSRYVTPLINPIIYYFRYVKNAKKIESIMKTKYDNNRIINQNGRKTEWFNIKLDDLISGVEQTISEYNKTTQNQENENYHISIKQINLNGIEFNDSNTKNYENYYSINNNNQTIGEFTVLHEMNSNNEINITNLYIINEYNTSEIISEITDKLLLFLEKEYPNVCNYVIDLWSISFKKNNLLIKSSNEPDENSEKHFDEINNAKLLKIFIDCVMHNKKYYMFKDSKENSRVLIISKPKNLINNKIHFKKNNNCYFIISTNIDITHPINHDEIKFPNIDEIIKLSDSDEGYKLIYKRNFSVTQEIKKCNKNNPESISQVNPAKDNYKYTSIKIIFDEPIFFYGNEKFIDDLYFKFIVNNNDYTSNNTNLSGFSLDYRLNKCFGGINNATLLHSFGYFYYVYVIYGFSYFKTPTDYANYHYNINDIRRNKYPELCEMVKNIYNDCS
jgi:hypothetical protein